MKIEKFSYGDQQVRYILARENGVLFNTIDVCRVLNITDRPAGTALSVPCMDIVSLIRIALSEGRNEMDFVDAVQEKFIGYDLETPIHPNCDDNWENL